MIGREAVVGIPGGGAVGMDAKSVEHPADAPNGLQDPGGHAGSQQA